MVKIFILLHLMLLHCSDTLALCEPTYTEEICSVGEVTCCLNDNDFDPVSGYIILQDEISCDGYITEWGIEGRTNSGYFYACVWEPVSGGFKLLAYNKISSIGFGEQSFKVNISEQIRVKYGYKIGVIYDEGIDSVLWATDEYSIDVYSIGILNHFHDFSDGSADIRPGHVVDTPSLTRVAFRISLHAKVRDIVRTIRLWPLTAPREGRAEIEVNGDWGTICDLWVVRHGWPLTFCWCLGYPEDLVFKYVEELDSTDISITPADNQVPIHLKSPHLCAPSFNRTMHECPVHPNGNCGHDKDVYVKCANKARCVILSNYTDTDGTGCVNVLCVPQYWLEGKQYWSNLCETRGARFALENPYSWAPAYCKEVGYDTVSDITFTAGNLPTDVTEVADMTCHGDGSTDVEECQVSAVIDSCPQDNNTGVPAVLCKSCPS